VSEEKKKWGAQLKSERTFAKSVSIIVSGEFIALEGRGGSVVNAHINKPIALFALFTYVLSSREDLRGNNVNPGVFWDELGPSLPPLPQGEHAWSAESNPAEVLSASSTLCSPRGFREPLTTPTLEGPILYSRPLGDWEDVSVLGLCTDQTALAQSARKPLARRADLTALSDEPPEPSDLPDESEGALWNEAFLNQSEQYRLRRRIRRYSSNN
jgi:hypothetical protein